MNTEDYEWSIRDKAGIHWPQRNERWARDKVDAYPHDFTLHRRARSVSVGHWEDAEVK